MQRFGMGIKIKSEFVDEYIKLHAQPTNELLEALNSSHIKNNSVFYGEDTLFNYFEYDGDGFKSDWEKYINTDIVRNLFNKMGNFFLPLGSDFPETGWTVMQEVFRKD